MAYKVRLKSRSGKQFGNMEWLCRRDINNDGGGFTKGTCRRAYIFEDMDEIKSDDVQKYIRTTGLDYEVVEADQEK